MLSLIVERYGLQCNAADEPFSTEFNLGCSKGLSCKARKSRIARRIS